MVTEQERQAVIDEEQLRWLPIGYWISAGFWGAYGLFMMGYFVLIGSIFISIPWEEGAEAPPPQFGWIFLAIGVVGFLLMGAFVAFKVLAGFWIRKHQHRVATMVIAAITCLEIPYGTLLGVLTFLALSRPTVRALYESGAPPYPTAPPRPGAVRSATEADGSVT